MGMGMWTGAGPHNEMGTGSWDGDGGSGVNILTVLPENPNDLLGGGWEETTHPKAKEAGHLTYENPKTGIRIRFDKAKPGASGFKGKDHYHIENPDSTGDGDKCFDKNGNAVPDNSRPSHILPGEGEFIFHQYNLSRVPLCNNMKCT